MVRRKTWLIIACPCSKSVTIFIQFFFGGTVEDFHQKNIKLFIRISITRDFDEPGTL